MDQVSATGRALANMHLSEGQRQYKFMLQQALSLSQEINIEYLQKIDALICLEAEDSSDAEIKKLLLDLKP
eukprot:2049496-Lingulodinium_polyedra.AAC.1